jgi:hypothetical protein
VNGAAGAVPTDKAFAADSAPESAAASAAAAANADKVALATATAVLRSCSRSGGGLLGGRGARGRGAPAQTQDVADVLPPALAASVGRGFFLGTGAGSSGARQCRSGAPNPVCRQKRLRLRPPFPCSTGAPPLLGLAKLIWLSSYGRRHGFVCVVHAHVV